MIPFVFSNYFRIFFYRMRNLFILALLAGFRVAWTLTEGAPNCPVVGNWSDSEGTKTLMAWSAAPGNRSAIDHMEFNMGGYKLTHVHDITNSSKALNIFNSPAFVVLVANATGPDNYSSTEKTIVELICANNILFVDVLPASDIASQETTFALRRRTLSPLNEEPQISPASSPSITPQFILVNITLPRRQEDDSNEYKEDYFQRNVDAQRDATVTENDFTGADLISESASVQGKPAT